VGWVGGRREEKQREREETKQNETDKNDASLSFFLFFPSASHLVTGTARNARKLARPANPSVSLVSHPSFSSISNGSRPRTESSGIRPRRSLVRLPSLFNPLLPPFLLPSFLSPLPSPSLSRSDLFLFSLVVLVLYRVPRPISGPDEIPPTTSSFVGIGFLLFEHETEGGSEGSDGSFRL